MRASFFTFTTVLPTYHLPHLQLTYYPCLPTSRLTTYLPTYDFPNLPETDVQIFLRMPTMRVRFLTFTVLHLLPTYHNVPTYDFATYKLLTYY